MIEAKGGELKDADVSALIGSQEMYRQSTKKKGESVQKVGAGGGGASGSGRPRDQSQHRRVFKCFRCDKEDNLPRDCEESLFCKNCNVNSHCEATCWGLRKVNRAKLTSKGPGKDKKKTTSKNKAKTGKSHMSSRGGGL